MKQHKGNIGMQKRRAMWRRRKQRTSHNYEIDALLKKNIQTLKSIGKYNENDRQNPYSRTDGEEIVARTLAKLKIRYIPQYYLGRLNGDNCNYRISDFYLPKEKLHIEFLGRWDKSELDNRSYKYKMAIYHRNNIQFVSIFPNNLFNITWVLKTRIQEKLNPPKTISSRSPIGQAPTPVSDVPKSWLYRLFS